MEAAGRALVAATLDALVRVRDDVERFLHLMADDLGSVDHELGEDRLVQDALDQLVARGVRLAWIGQQFNCRVEDRLAGDELVFNGGQAALNLGSFGADGLQVITELVLGPAFLGGKIEIIGLFLVEGGQPCRELFASLAGQAEVFLCGFVEHGADLGQEVGR